MDHEFDYQIAVILPCYNEALTIAQVIQDFSKALPQAAIYVYDNNSADRTVAIAQENGAIVRKVSLQGKGNVVRRMFADIDADIYVMADGDGTYDALSVKKLMHLLIDGNLDVVIAAREAEIEAFPPGHRFGNWAFNKIVRTLFGQGLKDIFSGYRVFSHRFVKTFPAHSRGFEIETEMSIHILAMRLPFAEILLPYGSRPEGSFSKLKTYRDGLRILLSVLAIFKEVKPLIFFSMVSGVLAVISFVLGVPIISYWMETGLVPRLPTAILATGIGILACLSLMCGFILDGLAKNSRESKHMRYLMFQSPFEKK